MPNIDFKNPEQLNHYLMEFEDVASLGSCLFEQLEALFKSIAQASGDKDNLQATKLAELGEYLSQDFANTFDCQKESIKEAREALDNAE